MWVKCSVHFFQLWDILAFYLGQDYLHRGQQRVYSHFVCKNEAKKKLFTINIEKG